MIQHGCSCPVLHGSISLHYASLSRCAVPCQNRARMCLLGSPWGHRSKIIVAHLVCLLLCLLQMAHFDAFFPGGPSSSAAASRHAADMVSEFEQAQVSMMVQFE